MILPNFIILGAAKAGTTALYHYMRQHPQVGMSRIKETNYFALKDEPLDFRGPGDLDYIGRFTVTTAAGYAEQFADCGGYPAIGEASPLYLYHPDVPDRLRAAVPDAKFVIILRDPVERAVSAFRHLVRDDRETTHDFAEALALEDARVADRWEHIWHYRRMGLYAKQVERYTSRFDPDQLRVYTYHDFRTRPADVVAELFRFVGVDDTFRPDMTTRHNAAELPDGHPAVITDRARAGLRASFRADVLELQDLLGRDLSRWL